MKTLVIIDQNVILQLCIPCQKLIGQSWNLMACFILYTDLDDKLMSVNFHCVYRANGFANFRSCCTNHKRKWVLRFSIEPYGKKPDFPLPSGKY